MNRLGQGRKKSNAEFKDLTPLVLIAVFSLMLGFGGAAGAAEIYTFLDAGGERYYTNMPGPERRLVRLPLVAQTGTARGRSRSSAAGRSTHLSPPAHFGQAAFSAGKLPPAAQAYETFIASAGRRFDVDPNLIRAVIKAESGYNHQAVSPKGALGLMQLMPATAREMGVENAFDPGQNIYGGVRYLSMLLEALNGNLPLALAAYNAGPARVLGRNAIPPIDETRTYVRKVLNLYGNLKERNDL